VYSTFTGTGALDLRMARNSREEMCNSTCNWFGACLANREIKRGCLCTVEKKYNEINNAIQFSQWLACQKFRVLVKSKPHQSITEIDAWYFRKDIEPYPLGWLNLVTPFGFYYSEGFRLELDQYGQIQKVSVGMIQ
jgi:hypothetical protein